MKSLRRGKYSSNDSKGGNAPESVDELSLTAEKYCTTAGQAEWAFEHAESLTNGTL